MRISFSGWKWSDCVIRAKAATRASRPACPGGSRGGASAGPAAESRQASLLVVVRPWGELVIDGKLVGTTPLDWIPVPTGQHVLLVRHPSAGTWEQSVTVEPGGRNRIVVDLSAARRPK